jgi:hypothetical protein
MNAKQFLIVGDLEERLPMLARTSDPTQDVHPSPKQSMAQPRQLPASTSGSA